MKKDKKLPNKASGGTIGTILGGAIGAAGFLAGPGVGVATTQLGMQLGQKVGSSFDEDPNSNKMIPEPTMPRDNSMLSRYGTSNQFFADGGMLLEPNAEIEGGEIAITPNGKGASTDGQDLSKISSTSFKSNGSKHYNGGHEVNLPEGTMIASDQIVNPLTGRTFAKDIEKQEKAKGKMEKRLKLRPNDTFIKKSAERSDIKSKELFDFQENIKVNDSMKNDLTTMFAKGGLIKYDGLSGSSVVRNPNATNDVDPNNPFGTNNIYQGTGKWTTPSTWANNANVKVGQSSVNDYSYNPNETWTTPDSWTNNNNVNIVPEVKPSTPFKLSNYNDELSLVPGLIGTGMQFAESFKKDPITRIRNNNATATLETTDRAIANQNALRYDVDDQLADISSSEAASNKYIDSNVSGGGSRVASRLSNRAKSLRLRNQIMGERNRMETMFKQRGNEMLLGKANTLQALGSEDANYENAYQTNILQRDANLRSNKYSSLSNMSTMGQQYNRDKELMELLPLMYPNAKLTR